MLLRAALFGDPLHANLGLGRVQMASQQPAEAEQSFRAALAAWDKGAYGIDDRTEARVGLARALLARDAEEQGSATVLDAAVRDDGGSPRRATGWRKVRADQGDRDKARAQADKAVELDDAYAEALALDGDLWRAADKDKAKKAYKKYLEVAPSGGERQGRQARSRAAEQVILKARKIKSPMAGIASASAAFGREGRSYFLAGFAAAGFADAPPAFEAFIGFFDFTSASPWPFSLTFMPVFFLALRMTT